MGIYLEDKHIPILLPLFGSLIISCFGILCATLLLHAKKSILHIGKRVTNEILGTHQLIYVIFFLTLSISAQFEPDWVSGMLIYVGPFLSILAYFLGAYSVMHLDNKIEQNSNTITRSFFAWLIIHVFFTCMSLYIALWSISHIR